MASYPTILPDSVVQADAAQQLQTWVGYLGDPTVQYATDQLAKFAQSLPDLGSFLKPQPDTSPAASEQTAAIGAPPASASSQSTDAGTQATAAISTPAQPTLGPSTTSNPTTPSTTADSVAQLQKFAETLGDPTAKFQAQANGRQEPESDGASAMPTAVPPPGIGNAPPAPSNSGPTSVSALASSTTGPGVSTPIPLGGTAGSIGTNSTTTQLSPDTTPTIPTPAVATPASGLARASPGYPGRDIPANIPTNIPATPSGLPAPGDIAGWRQVIAQQVSPELAKVPQFIDTVLAGALAESGLNPQSVQQGGGGRGFFQFDVGGGMGTGLGPQQLFSEAYQASKIIPLYEAAWKAAPANLSPADKAAWVAVQAERPDDRLGQASARYRNAFATVSGTPQGLPRLYTPEQISAASTSPTPLAAPPAQPPAAPFSLANVGNAIGKFGLGAVQGASSLARGELAREANAQPISPTDYLTRGVLAGTDAYGQGVQANLARLDQYNAMPEGPAKTEALRQLTQDYVMAGVGGGDLAAEKVVNPATQGLIDMMNTRPPPAASDVPLLEQLRRGFVRSFTDSRGDLGALQADAMKSAGVTNPAPNEMAYELAQLNPTLAAQVGIQRDLIPAIQSVGNDRKLLSAYLIHQDNVDVAAAMNNPTRKFSNGLSAADSQAALAAMPTELGAARFQKIQDAANQVYQFNQKLLQDKVDAGLISQQTANDLIARYPHYVRTEITNYLTDPNKIAGGSSLSSTDTGLRRNTFEGTDDSREDPLVSTIRNAYETQSLVNKNNTFNALVNLVHLDPNGLGQVVKQVPQDFTDTRSMVGVNGYVNGVKEKYAMPVDLETAIRFAPTSPIPGLNQAMAVIRGVMATRNPLFIPTHAQITILPYLVRTLTREGGPTPANLVNVVGELGKSYLNAFQGITTNSYSGDAARFLEAGGGQFGAFDPTVTGGRRSLEELTRTSPLQINNVGDLARIVRDTLTLQPVESIINRVDLAPRVAAYNRALARGANEVQAATEGRTATIDFQRSGTFVKTLNQVIPFLNVGAQAAAQVPRAFADNPRAFLATAVATLAVPTVLAEAWNQSDPQRAQDYADVPQYIKDRGLVLMLPNSRPVDAQGVPHPQFVTIPTREFTPFVIATREIANRAMGGSPRGLGDLLGNAVGSVLPVQPEQPSNVLAGLIPPGVKEATELGVNKDFYSGKDIQYPQSDVAASPLAQTVASGMNRILPSVKPSQVDYAMRSLGGGPGMLARTIGTQPQPGNQVPQNIPIAGPAISRFVRGDIGEGLALARQATLPQSSMDIISRYHLAYSPKPAGGYIRGAQLSPAEAARYQQLENQHADEEIHKLEPRLAGLTQSKRNAELANYLNAAHLKAEGEMIRQIGQSELNRRAADLNARAPTPIPASRGP